MQGPRALMAHLVWPPAGIAATHVTIFPIHPPMILMPETGNLPTVSLLFMVMDWPVFAKTSLSVICTIPTVSPCRRVEMECFCNALQNLNALTECDPVEIARAAALHCAHAAEETTATGPFSVITEKIGLSRKCD